MRQAIILFLCFMLLTSNLLYSKLLNQNIPDASRLTISGSGFRKGQSNFILKKWNKTFSAADHLAEPVWLNDSSFVISYELKHPQMAILTSNFGSYDIYITPGDNIKIILTSVYNKPTLQFKGRNSGNYNYSNAVNTVLRNNIPTNAIENNNDHSDRAQLIKRAYIVIDSFNVMFLQDENISTKFKKYIDSYKYWLVINIFCPFPAIVKNKVIPDNFLVHNKYLNDPLFLESRSFTLALSYYITTCMVKGDVNSLTKDNLGASAKIGIERFKGLIREYILMDLIQIYGRNQNKEWANEFEHTVQKAVSIVKDPEYLASIYSWNAYFHKGNKPIPEDIQVNTILIDTTQKSFTLSEVLDNAKGTLLLIDFWATWCGPCKIEFDFYNQHPEIFQNRGLKYEKVFLSIDEEKDFGKWKIDIQKYSLGGLHYIIKDSKMSDLIKYLQINGIPHYIIIDKDGVLRSLDAPRPSNFQQYILTLKDIGT